MNVITWLDFEHTDYTLAGKHLRYYVTATPAPKQASFEHYLWEKQHYNAIHSAKNLETVCCTAGIHTKTPIQRFPSEYQSEVRFIFIKLKTNRRCPWCNGYRRRKWTRRHEFKSWTRMIAFHVALIPLGKVWIQLFSLQLWVNSRTDWVL